MRLTAIHRYLSLACLAFWLLQAATGVALVFRWEMDDAAVTGLARPLDPAAIERRISALERSGAGKANSVWASGGRAGRFDIYLDTDKGERVVRVTGDGQVLRVRQPGATFADGAGYDLLTSFHQTLLLGDLGKVIVGVSGLLLFTNIVLGLKLGWPREGLGRALARSLNASAPARLWSWHRALGLVAALPLLVIAGAGALLAFVDPLEAALGAALEPPKVAARAAAAPAVGPARAMTIALRRYPGAALSGISFPAGDAPWYRVRLHARGEIGRIYGTTTVYLARDGALLLDHDARRPGATRGLLDGVYPIHTLQAGGLVGRTISLMAGLALLGMLGLGLSLWLERRGRRAAARRRDAEATA